MGFLTAVTLSGGTAAVPAWQCTAHTIGGSGGIRVLSFPAAIKVYLCTVPCDMRRSFDGLSMLAEHVIQCNPSSGHLLVFCNRRSDRVKILYWDRDGWAIWYKRLEAGTFQFPFAPTGRKEVAAWELAVLLEGIDLDKGKRRKRYSLPAAMKKEETEKGGMETRAS